jgi:phosphatidylserine/phosphatidylglycerophosphate/cardiolipin synthase-like enzyme
LLGPILYDLNHNFCEAWGKSTRPSGIFEESCWLVMKATAAVSGRGHQLAALKVMKDRDSKAEDIGFIKSRQNISLRALSLPTGQHSVQLLRTQPLYGEKAVKECYANLTRQTLHYIFIQNQYIQYQDWADHLIECVGRLREAGYLRPIYVFMLTSTPESDGMDWPTYDVASKVGMSETMRVEHEKALKEARKKKIKPPITAAELADHGINVFMGSLWTCAETGGKLRPEDYEEIYIHAKVAVVDDAAFTIGSGNLNLRSMALDSELNVLSEAKDVAYQLRTDLFSQCTGKMGPVQFGDMTETFKDWNDMATTNADSKTSGAKLKSQLLPFYVDRKTGSPVV